MYLMICNIFSYIRDNMPKIVLGLAVSMLMMLAVIANSQFSPRKYILPYDSVVKIEQRKHSLRQNRLIVNQRAACDSFSTDSSKEISEESAKKASTSTASRITETVFYFYLQMTMASIILYPFFGPILI
jgi:hypothetical protein